eukprot:485311-Rhodomonas_salina.1
MAAQLLQWRCMHFKMAVNAVQNGGGADPFAVLAAVRGLEGLEGLVDGQHCRRPLRSGPARRVSEDEDAGEDDDEGGEDGGWRRGWRMEERMME